MLNLNGMLKSPKQQWKAVLKPSGMSRVKSGKIRIAEYEINVFADSKQEAAIAAREAAPAEGFNGYAITRLIEV